MTNRLRTHPRTTNPSMSTSKNVDLFGGAITASIPAAFKDASDIRPVPPAQEVFLHPMYRTTLIVDLTTRVDLPDSQAVDMHFEDVAEEPGRVVRVFGKEAVVFENFRDKPAYTILGTIAKQNDEGLYTAMMMTVLRLENVRTDVVVTVNVEYNNLEDVRAEGKIASPLDTAEKNGVMGPRLTEAVAIRDEVLKTFKIRDWELFVDE